MGPQEQSTFEVFALVEIGYHEPESNANKRSICFLMKINSQIFFPFHYSLRCHVLLHDRSIYFCLQLQCLLFQSRIFYNYNRSFLQLHCVIGTCAIQTLKQNQKCFSYRKFQTTFLGRYIITNPMPAHVACPSLSLALN